MNSIKNVFDDTTRYLLMPWKFLLFLYGSRRVRKWMKKNEKLQDNNHHDFKKRWEYIVGKSKTIVSALGVKVVIVGKDYIPKGSYMLVANHSSNFDAFYLLSALGDDSPATSIAKQSLEVSKIRGYFQGTESFFVYTDNPRKSLINFNRAGEWAKTNNRGVVIFPEGKRNWNTDMSEFSAASFKLSQRNYLPIHPVSILGTLEGRKWYRFGKREVKIIFHKPIRASESIKLSTMKLAEKTQAIIKEDLSKYESTFKGKALEHRIKEKAILAEKQEEYSIKFKKEQQKLIQKKEKVDSKVSAKKQKKATKLGKKEAKK